LNSGYLVEKVWAGPGFKVMHFGKIPVPASIRLENNARNYKLIQVNHKNQPYI
jgi:hypothetical protein